MLHAPNTPDIRHRRPHRLTATLAALALAGAGLLSAGLSAAAPASADPAAQPVRQDFGYTGQSQTFTVPDGVLRVYVAATGGAGGDGNTSCHGVGGAAGKVTGYLDVHPGDQISFFVGGGGHLSGAGGQSDPHVAIGAGGDGGADAGVGSGNGGGGGGATSVRYLFSTTIAGGGGGGGGRGISLLQCGGDGGAGGHPPLPGFNGTASTSGCYGYRGGIEGGLVDITGGTGPGASGAGGGGGGGDGAKPGQGGGASQCTVAAGGGGGGGGGLSMAGTALQDVQYSTSGQHGADGSVAFVWGNVTTTSVPPATARGGDLPLHAIVSGGDGGGTVDFSYPDGHDQVPIPGCTGLPLVGEGLGVYEATCNAATQLVGADIVYATYSGDFAYGRSIGSNSYTVTQLPSTTTLSARSETVDPGGDAALAATVTGIDGYGKVTLSDNGAFLSGACGPLTSNGSSWTTSCQERISSGVHSFVVTYSGDRGYLSSSSAPVTVTTTGEPSITGTPPAGTVGQHYTFGYTLAGHPVPTVSVASASLPPGLTLTADGRLTGTPTAAGTFTYMVAAANSVDTATITSTVTVDAAVPGAPTVGTVTAGDGSATLTFTPPASDGGASISSYTVTATPTDGGAAVTATGSSSPITVSGLTDRTGYLLTVTATNAVGTGPASAASTPVTPVAPLAISTTTLPGGQVGSAYKATLGATGGRGDYTWSLSGGTLPERLSLAGDGTISGSPTAAGRVTLTVRVTDPASGQTATAALRLAIAPMPSHADLAVTLQHVGRFRTGGYGSYRVSVANTGTAATSGPTRVTVALPHGLAPQRANGAGWRCARHHRTEICTHARPIRAGHRSVVSVLARISAPAGTTVSSTAKVSPTDATPADNTASNRVTVIGRPAHLSRR